MVLITASTVSAILSAGIIALFTFLLFLAGYVLQQQSVNSLREAIRQPPPAPPKPVLPAQFRTEQDEGQDVAVTDGNETNINEQIAQFLAQDTPSNPQTTIESPTEESVTQQHDSIAYVLALSHPSDLCSASLFARALAFTPTTPDRLVLLYPSTWETSLSALHLSALTFMRELHDTYPIIFHPVEFVKGWETAATHAHLLGELQRTPWEFSRMLYLKAPGMVVDAEALRDALRTSSAKKMWTPMTSAVGEDPGVLMWERRRGLLMPRGEMRDLVGYEEERDQAEVESTSREAVSGDDSVVELEEKAYVLFGNEERDGKSELLLKFEDGLRSVCSGKGLLIGEQDRVELRRS